jgi:hypothetical protein
MDPFFLQSAMQQHAAATAAGRPSFTNTSSQQLNPGLLPQFFAAQGASRQAGPETTREGEVGPPEADRWLMYQLSEERNPSERSQSARMQAYFSANNPATKRPAWRTYSQRGFGVPDHLLELRAVDLY